jgi:ABC-type uncharacterized transport system permease subunit
MKILTSLMLTYASVQLIYYLVPARRGRTRWAWAFPQTRRFCQRGAAAQYHSGHHRACRGAHRHHRGADRLVSSCPRSVFGYQVRVVGAAPHAARYGGFSENKTIWLALLASGALAGFAGALEVSGAVPAHGAGFPHQLRVHRDHRRVFWGRLNPLGRNLCRHHHGDYFCRW